MRNAILVLILLVVALIIAFATGFLDLKQTRGAQAPDISADANGVSASGGQPPAFDVETGKVAIGTESKNVTVQVPKIEVQRPSEPSQAVPAKATN